MNPDYILPYVKKAKSYGNRVLIVSQNEEQALAQALASSGLEVRYLRTYDIILTANPEHRNDLVWAHTVIFFGFTVQIDSGVAFNLISKTPLQENIPHEVFSGIWQQYSESKLASFHDVKEAWSEIVKVWPELPYKPYTNEIGIVYAGAEHGISVAHICTCELVDYVEMLRKTGAKKFLCYNLMETAQLDSILRIQLLATAMPGINCEDFIYVTAASNMESSWKQFCIDNQIENPISIMSGNWYDQTWWNTSWNPLDENIDVPDFDPTYLPPKTFLCFNNVPRWHRTTIVTELVHNNLLENGLVSLRNNNPIHFDELDLEKTRPEATQWLKDNIPLSIDDTDARLRHMAFPDTTNVALHRDTNFSIVTETIFQRENTIPPDNSTDFVKGGFFFTEKTYKPFWFKQAFVLAAVPGMLQYLKSIGWQTFSPYIDESYDNEIDDNKRLEMIINEVKRLNSYTDEQWLSWRQGVQPAIEHNAQRIRREHSGDLTTSHWEELFK